MGRYINFLFSVTLRKKGLYIVFVTLLAIFFGMMFVSIREANNDDRQGLFPVSTFIAWIPFIFTTIFSGLLILRIFKTGEQDGTELLISAKPITRKQLILGKFFVLITMIMAFHVLLFLSYFGMSFLDKQATTDEKLRYAASIAFGGMIVSIIITSIIVILTSALGKVGTMVISILMAALVPVISFILIPTSKAVAPSYFAEEDKFLNAGKLYTTDAPDIYDKPNTSKTKSNNNTFDLFDGSDARRIKNNTNSWYKYAKYGDLWYQWGRFFSMFKGSKQYPKSIFGMTAKHATYDKLSLEEIYNRLSKLKHLTVDRYDGAGFQRGTRLLLLTKEQIEFEKKLSRLVHEQSPKIFDAENLTNLNKPNNLENLFDDWLNAIKANATKFNSMVKPYNSKGPVEYTEEFYAWRQKELDKIVKKYFGFEPNSISWGDMKLIIWRLMPKFQSKNVSSTSSLKHKDFLTWLDVEVNKISHGKVVQIPVTDHFLLDISNNNHSHKNYIDVFKKVDSKTGKHNVTLNILDDKDVFVAHFSNFHGEKIIINYKEEEYLSTTLVVLMWTAIAIGLVSASIFTYMRRDFK